MTVIGAAAHAHRDDPHGRISAIRAVSRDSRFEALVQRHERRLRRLIFGMIGDASRVEDVLQEALLRAYRGLPKTFAHENVEAAWIFRIAHRCALNELRARRRRPESPGLPDVGYFDAYDEAVAAHEIVDALATLDVRSRAAVLLVDLVGLDYASAARVLRLPRGTLAWRLSTARRELKERLDG